VSAQVTSADAEANLIFFIHDRLESALENADKIDSSGSTVSTYSALDLLEAFLWLHLGITVGYFPQPLSRRVAYEYSVPILKAHDIILSNKQSDTWLAQPMRNILAEEWSGRSPLLTIPERSDVPQFVSLELVFQNAFLLANSFARNKEATRIVTSISLTSEPVWQETFAKERKHPLQADDSETSLHQGFLQTVDYMTAVFRLYQDTESTTERRAKSEPTPRPDAIARETRILAAFFERVKQVQQWRLNFGYPTPRERFLQIADATVESLIPSDQPASQIISNFRSELAELLRFWGAPHSKSAGA
jgi:hypothetical protein